MKERNKKVTEFNKRLRTFVDTPKPPKRVKFAFKSVMNVSTDKEEQFISRTLERPKKGFIVCVNCRETVPIATAVKTTATGKKNQKWSCKKHYENHI